MWESVARDKDMGLRHERLLLNMSARYVNITTRPWAAMRLGSQRGCCLGALPVKHRMH